MHSCFRWYCRFVIFVGAVVLAFGPVPSAEAQTKTLRWQLWDADIQINADGSFRVQEQYRIEFIGGDFSYGFRNVPINRFVSLVDFHVGDEFQQYTETNTGGPFTFYVTQDAQEYVVYWFFPLTRDAVRSFTVEYTVNGGVLINAEVGDRLFWKAVGPDHAFPIESSTVTVHMPPGAQVDTSLIGENCRALADNSTVVCQAVDIPAQQEFEVGVRFPHGYVTAEPPAWQAEYERDQAWNDEWRPILNLGFGSLGAVVLAAGIVAMYLLWLVAGRDPDVGPVPSYLSAPPSDLPPGIVGTLVDEKADLQDIMATVIDLAHRRIIEIEEREKTIFGLTTSHEFTFYRVVGEQNDLRSHEQRLLEKMFGPHHEVGLDSLREKFYTAIPKIQQDLYRECVSEGLFPRSPKSIRGRYTGLGVAGLVLSAGVGFCSGAAFPGPVEALFCPFVALGIISVVLIVVGQVMPAKTRKGAEEAAKWGAFRSYLRSAERYRDLREAVAQFDRYLPYAIAFGLERAWVNKFSRIEDTPIPRWYIPVGMSRSGMSSIRGADVDLRGGAVKPDPSLGGMSDRMFGSLSSMSSGLFSMLNSASSAFTSVPRSSGSGGGGFRSGGGFSGGGFSSGGGGGGAGFG